MKINFIKKIVLIFFLNISIDNIYASGNQYDANMVINWWNLGIEYSSKPALGWLYFTFFMFLLITVYYGKKILKISLTERSKKIERNIKQVYQLKTTAKKTLSRYHNNIKLLRKSLHGIMLELINTKETEKKNIKQLTINIIKQISDNTDKSIRSSIKQAEVKLRQDFVHNIILEVIEEINKNPMFFYKNYARKVIKNLSNLNLDTKDN